MKNAPKKLKAGLEEIQPNFGSSFLAQQFNGTAKNKTPEWHFHPEIELVYVSDGNGKRHVGQHLSYFSGGDLLLIGSNLPHYGFTDRLVGNTSETVIQMKPEFLGENFFDAPEMKNIGMLFNRAKMGIAFGEKTKKELGDEIIQLTGQDPQVRLLSLLKILNKLAKTKDYQLLNGLGMQLEVSTKDGEKVNRIFAFVRENFKRNIGLEEIAGLSKMTVPSFCRFFKKKSGKSFTHFVNEYRLVHASKLLSEGKLSISEVSQESGFNNFSHFNKVFKKFTGKNPSAYRNQFRILIS